MKKHRKKKELNDLILPVIFILAILPFITHLIVYDCGLSKYPWYFADGTVTDFFSYYKNLAFVMAGVISGVILAVYCYVQRKSLKSMKAFIPIAIYAGLVILSTIFSIDRHTSIVGGLGHFESALVLMGYLVVLIYTYQIKKREEDYQSIFKAILLSLSVLCLIGILQMAGKDLLSFTWFQKLVIPRQHWKEFLGKIGFRTTSNAVSLTLFNPNFAAVYLGMMIPFLTALILPERNPTGYMTDRFGVGKKERIICGIIIALLAVLLYKTYSRAGLVAALAALLIPAILYRKALLRSWKKLILVALSAVVLFVGIDYLNDFRYIEKLIGTVNSLSGQAGHKPLEEIITGEDGITIRYKGGQITVALTGNEASQLKFLDEAGTDITGYYDDSRQTLDWMSFDEIKFVAQEKDGTSYVSCLIDGLDWSFFKDADNGYRYVNGLGKADDLKKVERFGFYNTESIGSGRGYIWSRSIPILKDTIFLGTGPDTFILAFPQSDYVGKANNCKTPYTIIEKPHNFYLMTGIQTGILSLLALLSFCALYLVQSFRIYRKNTLSSFRNRMGFGCFLAVISFMISGLFNDSSLQTSPVFYVLLGLGLDINWQIRKGEDISFS